MINAWNILKADDYEHFKPDLNQWLLTSAREDPILTQC